MNKSDKEQNSKDPCKRYACKLQYCLEKNNYREEKCLMVVDELKHCCYATYNESSSAHISPTCSGFMSSDKGKKK
jgi:hypothetical protein